MPSNPYAPPTICDRQATPERQQALWTFRLTFGILLLPALFNYFAFDTRVLGAGPAARSQVVFRIINLSSFVAGSLLIWFLAFPMLEFLARLMRRMLAQRVNAERWDAIFYASIPKTVWLAFPGAFLWTMWVLGFYYLQLDFFWLSVAVGIPAHLLGAAWYLPLGYQWYRLARDAAAADPGG